MSITEQHLTLLREISHAALATDQDIGLSANVVVALLDEIVRLRSIYDELLKQSHKTMLERLAWERRARELESLCADRL